MTDLELTKACAEAMGFRVECVTGSDTWRMRDADGDVVAGIGQGWKYLYRYDPLNNDAQAMALVKRCDLRIDREKGGNRFAVHAGIDWDSMVMDANLNRAIVECVALSHFRLTTEAKALI